MEDHGKETYGSKDQGTKLRGQKRKTCDGPFLSRIFMWRNVLFEKWTLRFGPKNFVRLEFPTALNPGIRILIAWNSSMKQQNLYHQFSSVFLLGWHVNLFVLEYTLFHRICIPIVFCDVDIRKDAKNTSRFRTISTEVVFARFFGIPLQRDSGLWEISLSKNVARFFVSAVLEQERTNALLFYACSHRGGKLQAFPWCTVFLLSTDSILLVSSQRWHASLYEFSTVLLFQCVTQHPNPHQRSP